VATALISQVQSHERNKMAMGGGWWMVAMGGGWWMVAMGGGNSGQ
jgi:hypothetical protein